MEMSLMTCRFLSARGASLILDAWNLPLPSQPRTKLLVSNGWSFLSKESALYEAKHVPPFRRSPFFRKSAIAKSFTGRTFESIVAVAQPASNRALLRSVSTQLTRGGQGAAVCNWV